MATRQKRRSPANVRTFATGGTATHSDTTNYRERFIVRMNHTDARAMKQFVHALLSYGGLVQFCVVDEQHGSATLEGSKRICSYLLGHPAVKEWHYAMSTRIPFAGTGTTDEDTASAAKKKEIEHGRTRLRKKGVDQRPNERKTK